MRRKILLLCLTAAATGACDKALAPGTDALTSDDAQTVASQVDDLGSSALDEFLASSSVSFDLVPTGAAAATSVPVSGSFTRTVACPAGGQAVLAGTMTGQRDTDTHTVVTDTKATKTLTACAITRRNGATVTVDGSITFAAHHQTVNGALNGLQTQTHKGSLSYTTSKGGSGTCDIDITSTFDPATHTRTIKGTTCHRTVDTTITRS